MERTVDEVSALTEKRREIRHECVGDVLADVRRSNARCAEIGNSERYNEAQAKHSMQLRCETVLQKRCRKKSTWRKQSLKQQ